MTLATSLGNFLYQPILLKWYLQLAYYCMQNMLNLTLIIIYVFGLPFSWMRIPLLGSTKEV